MTWLMLGCSWAVVGCGGGSKGAATASHSSQAPEAEAKPAAEPSAAESSPNPEASPKAAAPSKPAPPPDRKLNLAVTSPDKELQVYALADGTILIRGSGEIARVEGETLVRYPESSRGAKIGERKIIRRNFGGRWPDDVYVCWMAGFPNDPGSPDQYRFIPGKGWKKLSNGSGRRKWCYEGFGSWTADGLITRKIAHKFEEEDFEMAPFAAVGTRKAGFTGLPPSVTVPNPELPPVVDWVSGAQGELWALGRDQIIHLVAGESKVETFDLPSALAKRGRHPLYLSWVGGELYLHGADKDGKAYLAVRRDAELEPITVSTSLPVYQLARTHTDELWLLAANAAFGVPYEVELWYASSTSDPKGTPRWNRPQFEQYARPTAVVADGGEVWVSVDGYNYNDEVVSVVLTTHPIRDIVPWNSKP